MVAVPDRTAASSALQERPQDFYELGRYLRENGPELLQAAQDPSYLLPAAGAATLAGGAALGAALAAGPLRTAARRALRQQPGDVLLGYRRGRFGLREPVFCSLRDRLLHWQIVAPTAQAKTTLLEFLARQDLENGLTVLGVELLGDFRDKMLTQAFCLGVLIHYFDPTVPGSMKWNPLAGPTEQAAETAVSTFVSAADSGKEQFFKNFNAMVLRYSVKAVSLWAHKVEDREPTMADLRGFLRSPTFRKKVLGIKETPASKGKAAEKDGQGKGGSPRKGKGERIRVRAAYLDENTRSYFEEEFYGEYTPRQRGEFTSGLKATIEGLLGLSMVEEALTPEEGEPVLTFDERTLSCGGLVMVCLPQGLVGDRSAQVVASWMLMDFMQAARRRVKGGPPVSAFFDEVHNLLGHQNTELAIKYANFITGARHVHVVCHLSYQSFSLVPWQLMSTLGSNARNKLISGGLDHRDAKEAMAMMGSEEEVRDERRTFKGLFAEPGSYSVGKREMERPEISEHEQRYVPRGSWWCHRTINGRQQRPHLLRAGRAPRLRVRFAVTPRVPEDDYYAAKATESGVAEEESEEEHSRA
jgi:hypothetical protein